MPPRRQKRPRATADTLVGLSEIFQPDYQNPSLLPDRREHQTPNNNGTHELSNILDQEPLGNLLGMHGLESGPGLHGASQNSSLLSYGNANQELQGKGAGQAGRSGKTGGKSKPSSHGKRAANQASAKHANKARKGTAQEKGSQSTGGTRTGTGTAGPRRGSAHSTSIHSNVQKPYLLPPGKQVSAGAIQSVAQPSIKPSQLRHSGKVPVK